MLATLVPDQLTSCTSRQALDAIRSAYETLEGTYPSRETLAVLCAQAALETGDAEFELVDLAVDAGGDVVIGVERAGGDGHDLGFGEFFDDAAAS